MARDYLRTIGFVLLLGCGLSAASAAEAPGDVSPRGQAWAVLTRDPPEEDPAVLSRAILDVVRAGFPEDLDRLATYMQSYVFGEDFAIPPRPQILLPTSGTCPFKELMRSIAECDTPFAEELLVLYARSDFISQDRLGDREHQFRRSYVLQALGCLHPKTNGTYSLLGKELIGAPTVTTDPYRVLTKYGTDEYAFQALVSIGDERAAGVLRREMFRAGDWPRHLDIWVSDLAKGRQKPANFELLLSLAEQTSSTTWQERILPYLVERQIRRGSEGTVFEYPAYDSLPVSTRDKLLKVVSAADQHQIHPKGD